MGTYLHGLFDLPEASQAILRIVHEISSTTNLSFYPYSALYKQLHSLLCAYLYALNTNKNPSPVAELISCTILSWAGCLINEGVNLEQMREAGINLFADTLEEHFNFSLLDNLLKCNGTKIHDLEKVDFS